MICPLLHNVTLEANKYKTKQNNTRLQAAHVGNYISCGRGKRFFSSPEHYCPWSPLRLLFSWVSGYFSLGVKVAKA